MAEFIGKSLDDYIKDNKIAQKTKKISKEDAPVREKHYRSHRDNYDSGYHRRGDRGGRGGRGSRGSFRARGGRFGRSRPFRESREPRNSSSDAWSSRKDEAKSKGNSRSSIIVKNLHHDVSEEDLKTMFEESGKVKSVKIHWDKYNRSTGSATIEFAEESSVKKAIEEYNEAEIDGVKIEVKRDTGDSDSRDRR